MDLLKLPHDLREYTEEPGTHANFRNVRSYDNLHIQYEKLIVLLEKEKDLKLTT